jgi:hypothetical protein
MPTVRFEPMIPASERAKTVYALDRSATVTGKGYFRFSKHGSRKFDTAWEINSCPSSSVFYFDDRSLAMVQFSILGVKILCLMICSLFNNAVSCSDYRI